MLKTILWKHIIIRTNTWTSILLTICEFIIPVLVFTSTIFAKSKLGDFDKVYINASTYVNAISNEEILTRINVGSTMLLYAPDTQFTDRLVREAQLKLNLYNEKIKRYSSKDELIQHYNTLEHDGPTVVVLFNNHRHTIPEHLDYEIKIYEEGVLWNTDKLFSDLFVYTSGIGSETYLDKAFAAVQVALDTSFIEMVAKKPFNTSLTYQEFPYPPHLNTDGVTTSFQYILPLITIITFIFVCPITLKRIVLEKSSGLKELLKIAGVKSWMLWVGWFLNGILVNAISVILIAVVLTRAMFESNYPIIGHCNVVILAVFLLVYCSATITFFFAFSTAFNRATLAMVLGVLLWIISYIIFVGFAGKVEVMSASVKSLFLLFPPFGLYLGYNTISLFEMRETDITFPNVFESPTSSYDDLPLGFVIAALLLDTFLFFILTLYLDKVSPGQYGIAKPWYFLAEKIWKRKTNRNCINSADENRLLSQEETNLKPIVQLKNVTKIYDNHEAVSNLEMNIYKGSITGLLGENGAGKSTTMSMITGLTKATSGNIYIDGNNINDNVELARKEVSFCTQHNLLYNKLTVIQHLELFGMLKGAKSRKTARDRALELLRNTLGMEDKINTFVTELSGGMKRKLSLGIALMGNPKILILDEPTAGVDVEGRREIWDLILSFKSKKTVFISTHFLEEAEYLSDYIAIMDCGKLRCFGTPMDLKKEYEIGYKCSISYADQRKLPAVEALLKKTAPSASIVRKENDVVLCRFNVNSGKSEIANLLTELNEKKDQLAITYKLACSTLEDLYLKVQDEKGITRNKLQRSNSTTSNSSQASQQMFKYWCYSKKRLLFFWKKKLQYLVLTIMAFGIILLTLQLGNTGFADVSKDGTRISMDLNLYGNTDVYYSISGRDSRSNIDKHFKNIVTSSKSSATKVEDVPETIIAKGTENIVHYMKRMLIAAEFTLEDDDDSVAAVNVMHANKAHHGAPISIDVVMNTLLKYYAGDKYSISTANTPLHARTKKEQPLTQSQFSNVFLWVSLLPIGSLLIASTALLLPTTEYIKSTRILDKLCGIKSLEYWLLNCILDAIYCGLALSIILLLIYFIPVHSMDMAVMSRFWLVLLVYGIACLPFVYYFTHSDTVESGYARFLITHIIFAPIVAGILLAMEKADRYPESRQTFKSILFVLDPHILLCFYLAKFSIKMILNHNWEIMPTDKKQFLCDQSVLNDACCRPNSPGCIEQRTYFEMDFLYYAIISFVVYMFVMWIRDNITSLVYGLLHIQRPCKPDTSKGGLNVNENNLIEANNISKDYFAPRFWKFWTFSKAVKDLSFQLKKGSCLGLLGINGAGKSTSFRILTEEIAPTAGELKKEENATLGYCPQHNALLDDFTGREMLRIYGQLRNQPDLDEMVKYLLDKFGLKDIADKPCGKYSGGNKRKLSTCISIIGFPSCILLDEPTSGVDPVSRRELWDLIAEIKYLGNTGILLTSHSMDECEALCDRLCILKQGKVTENSSIEQLKEQYCVGHVLDIKLRKPNKCKENIEKGEAPTADQTDAVNKSIEQYLFEEFQGENVKMLGIHNAIMRVQIYNSNWLEIFEKIEASIADGRYNIEDYWVKEASLAEVLMSVAKEDPPKYVDA